MRARAISSRSERAAEFGKTAPGLEPSNDENIFPGLRVNILHRVENRIREFLAVERKARPYHPKDRVLVEHLLCVLRSEPRGLPDAPVVAESVSLLEHPEPLQARPPLADEIGLHRPLRRRHPARRLLLLYFAPSLPRGVHYERLLGGCEMNSARFGGLESL